MADREIKYTVKVTADPASLAAARAALTAGLTPKTGAQASTTNANTPNIASINANAAALRAQAKQHMDNATAIKASTAAQLANIGTLKTATTAADLATLSAKNHGMSMTAQAAAAKRAAKEIGGGGGGGSSGGLTGSLFSFHNIMKAVIALTVGNEILNMADQYAELSGKIRISTSSEDQALTVRRKLVAISMLTHTSLESNVESYEKLSHVARIYGKSQQDALNWTKALNMGLQIGGATAEQASTSVRQFAMVLSQGRANALGFNAMMRESPEFVAMLEKAMGKGIGFIRAQGSKGGADMMKDILDAMTKVMPEVEEKFKKLPVTMKKGWQDTKTGFLVMIGEIGEKMQSSQGLGNFFHRLGMAFTDPAVINAVRGLADMIGNVLTGALNALLVVIDFCTQHTDLLRAAFEVLAVVLAARVIMKIYDFIKALNLASKAMFVLTTLMQMNPWVLAAEAIAVVIGALWIFGDAIDASGNKTFTAKDVIIGAWIAIKQVIGDVVGFISDVWNGNIEEIKEKWGAFGVFVASIMQQVWDAIKTVTSDIAAIFITAYRVIAVLWSNFPGAMSTIFRAVANAGIGAAEAVVNAWKDGLNRIGNAMKNAPGIFGAGAALMAQATSGGPIKLKRLQGDNAFAGTLVTGADVQKGVGNAVRAFGQLGHRNRGGGVGGATDADLNGHGSPEDMASQAGKGGKDKAAEAMKNLQQYVDELKAATAEQIRLTEASWHGPKALREMEVAIAGEKAVREQTEKLKDAKVDLNSVKAKGLLAEVKTAATEAELAKQADAATKMMIALRDAIKDTDEEAANIMRATKIIGLHGDARRKLAKEMFIENFVREKTKSLTREEIADTIKLIALKQDAARAAGVLFDAQSAASDRNTVEGLIDSTRTASEKAKIAYDEAAVALGNWIGQLTGPEADRAKAGLEKLRPPESVVDSLKRGIGSFLKDFQLTYEKIADNIKSIAGEIANAFVDMAVTGKANFKALAQSVIQQLLRMIVQALVFKAIMTGLNMIAPGLGSALMMAAPGHAGGIVGQGADMSRALAPSAFANARRFHSGGIVGLKGGERPIIAKDGEAILPTVRMPDGNFGVRAAGGGGKGSVFAPNININIDAKGRGPGGGDMTPEQQAKLSGMLENELNTHMQRKLEEWMRPGGPLYAARR